MEINLFGALLGLMLLYFVVFLGVLIVFGVLRSFGIMRHISWRSRIVLSTLLSFAIMFLIYRINLASAKNNTDPVHTKSLNP